MGLGMSTEVKQQPSNGDERKTGRGNYAKGIAGQGGQWTALVARGGNCALVSISFPFKFPPSPGRSSLSVMLCRHVCTGHFVYTLG